MAELPQACGPGLCGGKSRTIMGDGVWKQNPICVQMLGICSALAVTNKLANALVMSGALIFVLAGTGLFVSLLRTITPRRIRMIAEVAIIATFVILFDQFLKAYYYPMSRQLGPYVGLIITNCIVMARAEAFALQNKPIPAVLDGVANGLGYTFVLGTIAFFRELLGSGTVLGHTVLASEWYEPNQIMILAPGAFFALGFLIAIINAVSPSLREAQP